MNKSGLIEEITSQIPEFKGNEEEKEIKTALFVYYKLANAKEFDEKYYFGNGKTCKKIYEKSNEESEKIREIQDKKKLVCVTMASLYREILKDLGINAYLVKENQDDYHTINYIRLKSGKMIRADIQMDMLNVKTKSRLKNFNFLNYKNLTQEELTDMLIEVGYISNEEEYMDEEHTKLQDRLSGKKANDVVSILIEEINNEIKDKENFGITEVTRYTKHLIKKCVPENIRENNIFKFPCLDEKSGEYTFLIYSEEKDENEIYIYSPKHNKYLECDFNTIKKLKNDGLQIGITGKEKGIKKINRQIKGQIKKEEIQK